MGYVIARRKRTDKATGTVSEFWKVQYEDRRDGKRVTRDIPRHDWDTLGFRIDYSYEQACSRRDQLNASNGLKLRAEAAQRVQLRIAADDETACALLLPMDRAEFEHKYLYVRIPAAERPGHKSEIHWRTCRAIIQALKLEPSDWFEHKHVFYDYLSSKHYSPSYVRKLLQVLNLWGTFMAKQRRVYFLPIPSPKGREAQRIADSFYDANEHNSRVSEPLTPALLEKARSRLKPEQYNWLYVTVWFGLRPDETDSVLDPKRTKLVDGELHVYQSKLRSVARDKRWKRIPCKYPEQRLAFNLIERGGPFHRPLNKTLAAHVAPGVTCYGGRKNFVDMMLDAGHQLEDISIWMGHATIERTWRSYKDRQRSKRTA